MVLISSLGLFYVVKIFLCPLSDSHVINDVWFPRNNLPECEDCLLISTIFQGSYFCSSFLVSQILSKLFPFTAKDQGPEGSTTASLCQRLIWVSQRKIASSELLQKYQSMLPSGGHIALQ